MKELDHLAILVRDIQSGTRLWRSQLGFELSRGAEVADSDLARAFLSLDAAVADLSRRGASRRGVGTPPVVMEPRSASGVLIELWPKDRPHRWRNTGPVQGRQSRKEETG